MILWVEWVALWLDAWDAWGARGTEATHGPCSQMTDEGRGRRQGVRGIGMYVLHRHCVCGEEVGEYDIIPRSVIQRLNLR